MQVVFVSGLDALTAAKPSETSRPNSGEPWVEKLAREVQVIGGGTLAGTKNSLQHVVDHPGESLLKVASAAGIAGALALAQGATGPLGLAAEVTAGALGFSL